MDMQTKGTPMEALVAEMLGDIGRLHETLIELRGDMSEMDASIRQRIEDYARLAVEDAARNAVDSGAPSGPSPIELMLKMSAVIERLDAVMQPRLAAQGRAVTSQVENLSAGAAVKHRASTTPQGWFDKAVEMSRKSSFFIGEWIADLLPKNRLPPELAGAMVLGVVLGGPGWIAVGAMFFYLL